MSPATRGSPRRGGPRRIGGRDHVGERGGLEPRHARTTGSREMPPNQRMSRVSQGGIGSSSPGSTIATRKRRICRSTARGSIAASCRRNGAARWNAFTTHRTSPCASMRGARQVRAPRSLTARAPRWRKKGSVGRSSRLPCWQQGHEPQAAFLVGALGLMLGFVVPPGNVQDRDGAAALRHRTRRLLPFIGLDCADGG